jgi:hypothetical protein
MKKMYASALFAALASVALLGGCGNDKCEKCNKDAAAATSADAKADTAGGCCSKDAKSGEKSCSSTCGGAKDANAAAKSCSTSCGGAKDANAASAACGAKDGKACTKDKSECCGASKCAGTNTGTGTSNN